MGWQPLVHPYLTAQNQHPGTQQVAAGLDEDQIMFSPVLPLRSNGAPNSMRRGRMEGTGRLGIGLGSSSVTRL